MFSVKSAITDNKEIQTEKFPSHNYIEKQVSLEESEDLTEKFEKMKQELAKVASENQELRQENSKVIMKLSQGDKNVYIKSSIDSERKLLLATSSKDEILKKNFGIIQHVSDIEKLQEGNECFISN